MITVEIKKATQMPGKLSCYMTFSEYNATLIDIIRQFELRRYDPETKSWEFPLHSISDVLGRYKNSEITIIYNKEKERKQKGVKEIPELGLKRELFNHQKIAVEYGIHNPKYLLLDTVGLGKTSSVIAEAIALKKMGKIKQCLIVCCISDLQYNWAHEIEEVCDEDYFILGTRYKKSGEPYAGSVADRVVDIRTRKEFFLITNITSIRNDLFIKALKTKRCEVDFFAIDEVHKNGAANPTVQAGKNLLKLKDRFDYIIPITGTVLRNRPQDAWLPLTLIDKEHSNYSLFKRFYSIQDNFGNIIGYRNLDQLQKQLAECSLRRTYREVLDLPPMLPPEKVYVTMNDSQAIVYKEAVEWALDNIDMISDSPNPLGQLIRLRQATGYTGILSSTIKESAKMDRIESDLEDILENGDKVIIFSNWTDTTDELYNRLEKHYGNVLRITGKDVSSGEETERIKHLFNTDPNYKILIGTTGKLGTGHTLTGANWVLFLDEPWTMADKNQAIGRIERTGQTKSMHVRTYITKGTIDESVNRIVESKGDLADYVVDKKRKSDFIRHLLNVD